VPTSIRPSITKPRKSQLILEGTAALVSLVLILWLLLWFVNQRTPSFPVKVYHLPLSSGGVATHAVADVRGLSKVEAGTSIEPASASSLSSVIPDMVAREGPAAVVSISAPVVTGRDDLDLPALIRKVARVARRDVLIVLDLAQVDSDRELGVYGNTPYKNLLALRDDEKPTRKVLVLCSCSPGQKSWMIDGQGRSAFSYFLQAGLAGEARGDDPSGQGSLNVEGLYRFVLRNTENWVAEHRRGAIQTPMLLTVGKVPESEAKAWSFNLPALASKKTAGPAPSGGDVPVAVASKKDSSTGSQAKEAPSKPAEEQGGAGAMAPKALLASLIEEWKEHSTIESRKPAPFRHAPARWRGYESHLLRAERLVRASWNDPDLRDDARAALDLAKQRREELLAALREADDREKEFPFHPVTSDPKGAQALNESLRYVTRGIIEGLPWSPPIAPPAEGAAAGGTVARETAKDPLPTSLEEAKNDRPSRFLELQLPAWALRFHSTFKVEPFKDDVPGRLLRAAVSKRLPAETALGLDRRGLRWIIEDIRKGDEIRRNVQDDLFGVPVGQVDPESINGRIAEFGSIYVAAAGRSDLFRRARSLFEEIAARLPYYGEWAVLDESRRAVKADATSDDSPSPRLADVLARTGRLGDAIRRPAAPENLRSIVEQASNAFESLEADYRKAVEEVASGGNSVSWSDLDDVLATPSIPLADRELLLKRVVELESAPPDLKAPTSAAGQERSTPGPESRIDPVFLRKALGLARLEVKLWELGNSGSANADGMEDVDRLRKALDEIADLDDAKADEKKRAEIFSKFEMASEKARQCSRTFVNRLNKLAQVKGPESKVTDQLMAADQAARFRTSEELRSAKPDGDLASRKLETYASWSSIRFQAERLAQDFARGVQKLNEQADAIKEFDIDEGQPVRSSQGSLIAEVPAGPVQIDAEKRFATVLVGLSKAGEESGNGSKIPDGKAFIGVLVPPSKTEAAPGGKEDVKLKIRLETQAEGLGPNLAGGLFPTASSEPKPLPFQVRQLSTAIPDGLEKELAVAVFYRGRVDEERGKGVILGCRKFGPEFVIDIAQDVRALKDRYGERIARAIADQFEEHPEEGGAMHCRGRLEYVLTVTNRTPDPRDVAIEWKLTAAAGAPGKPSRIPRIHLAPQQSRPIRDSVAAADVPLDGPSKFLEVRVLDANTGVPIVEPRQIPIRQLRLEDSVVIKAERGNFNYRNSGVFRDCFRVTVTRKSKDPDTTPIMFRDIQFQIADRPPDRNVDDEKYLGRDEDNVIFATQPIQQGMKSIKWKVSIDGESRSDEFPIP
jgi:hypothetical protein